MHGFFSSLSPDPFETQNRVTFLTPEDRIQLHNTLELLKGCRGRSCTILRQGLVNDLPNNGNIQRGVKSKFETIGKIKIFFI